VHLEAAWIKRPSEAADHAALTRSVPAFQHDHGAMRRGEIGLLYKLKRLLHAGETAFVIGVLDHREVFHPGEMGAIERDEFA